MENNGQQMQTVVKDRRPGALGDLSVLPDEVICRILSLLSPRDVARLSCVSSVMYIFCNEEPLWMSLCLNSATDFLEYKGSWKETALIRGNLINADVERKRKPLQFDGFYSLFLYRRLYRCYTTLEGFSVDNGNIEKKSNLSLEEFHNKYDGKKPVLLTGLTDSWPARNTWTLDQLLLKYGDTPFKISQRSSHKIRMKFKDYVSYMKLQHDEDPLYIFDPKFGEAAPDLLKDYDVPHLFREDLFDVLDDDSRPAFRWLIIGPERSGASWHVDPALTSAWNTLLCGRKRWALYPPGKVPLGVTVHVDDEDGDVDIDTPSSLQWWLEFYPLLPDEDKPIECIQLPGETIFVPSGWWHCVLNLETTIAVTQNFVNHTNFEFVCLDMAPGYHHKGVCRAGWLAVDDGNFGDLDEIMCCSESCSNSTEEPRKEKRLRMQNTCNEVTADHAADCCGVWNRELPYEINFLSKFLDENRDHYNFMWSSSNCIGQREMREWLWKLWIAKPGMRDMIWKGACIALNAGKWFECIGQICKFHNLPSPKDDERLPVGTGSNPVYLIAGNVIKIYVEGGLESTLYSLGTELEFYDLLCRVKSQLKEHAPDILASGLIYLDNGCHIVVPWDGRGVPDVITDCCTSSEKCKTYSTPFGLWGKMLFECQKSRLSTCKSISASESKRIWPYIVTKRCEGKIFAAVRESLLFEDALDLASFIGKQLHNLHVLPLPELDKPVLADIKEELGFCNGANFMEIDSGAGPSSAQWEMFLHTLAIRRKDVVSRLMRWGDPIPSSLIDKVVEYLPDDIEKLISAFEGETCSWIHSDIMDDNIHMEPLRSTTTHGHSDHASANGNMKNGPAQRWRASYILDFSDMSVGDRILDVIPIYLDVFKGDQRFLKEMLSTYKLPLLKGKLKNNLTDKVMKFKRPSYRTMCYCILHEENVLGAIFDGGKELRMAKSWEEVEEKVWGVLNDYTDLS
uniref:JmjC domain-containing protein n=1 Tax=Opuntia streptacantha TaxID=393608 RepID=A0A7C9ARL2_OPUST